jgi:hypothetical protein
MTSAVANSSPKPSVAAGRLELFAPWLGGAVLAAPVLLAKYPPMADLPLHEASVGVLRHWGDQQFAPSSVYFLNFGHANQLFSFLLFLVSFVVPIGWATKIVVAFGLVALAAGAARFADHVAAPRWTALLVAPIGLGWLFFWGLVQNIIGLAVLLALLPTIDRFASKPTGRGALRMCGAMVLLHFAHQAMQLIACASIFFFSLGLPLQRRKTLLRAAPIAFGGFIAFVANRMAWRVAGPRHQWAVPFEWNRLSYKLKTLTGGLFAGYEPYVRNFMMVLAILPLALFVADRVRHRDRRALPFQERIHALRFELLALTLLLLYFVMPATIKSTTLVYQRFLPPAWAILAVCTAAGTVAIARPLGRALCAVLPVASVLVSWPTFVDSNRMYTDLEGILPFIDKGSSVLSLNLGEMGDDPPYRLWNPMVAMGHIVAVNGGRSFFDYTTSPMSPVSQRPEKQWSEPIMRMQNKPYELRPEWDFQRFRYVLASTPTRTLAAATVLAFRNDGVLIAHVGDWYLFESRLKVVPVDAPDAPLPVPHPPTIRKGLQVVAKELELIERAGVQPNGIASETQAP